MEHKYGHREKAVPEGKPLSTAKKYLRHELKKIMLRVKKELASMRKRLRNHTKESRYRLRQKRANTVNKMRCALKVKSRRSEKFRRGKRLRRDKRTHSSDSELEDGGQLKLPEVEGRAAAPTATARVRVDRL